MAAAHSQDGVASQVVLSVRAGDAHDQAVDQPDSEWLREQIREPAYVSYLKRAHDGPIAVGDEWEEFVSRGCGSPQDVVFHVERVEAGDELGPDTELEIQVPRDVDAA